MRPGAHSGLPADLVRGLLVALAAVLGLAVLDAAGVRRSSTRPATATMELDQPPSP